MAEHKQYQLGVKALIENEKGQILLLKKVPFDTQLTKQITYWDMPGGRVDEGQTPTEALARELNEETGITHFHNNGFFYAVVANTEANFGLILFIYTCIIEPNTPLRMSEEHTAMEWVDRKKASELLKVKYPEEFTTLLYR